MQGETPHRTQIIFKQNIQSRMDFPCFGAKKKDGLGEVAGGGRDLIKARHGNEMLKSSLAPCVREPLNTL